MTGTGAAAERSSTREPVTILERVCGPRKVGLWKDCLAGVCRIHQSREVGGRGIGRHRYRAFAMKICLMALKVEKGAECVGCQE